MPELLGVAPEKVRRGESAARPDVGGRGLRSAVAAKVHVLEGGVIMRELTSTEAGPHQTVRSHAARAVGVLVFAAGLVAAGPDGCVDEWLADPAGQPPIEIAYMGPDSVTVGTQWTLQAEVVVGLMPLQNPRLSWQSSQSVTLAVDSVTGTAYALRAGAALVTARFLDPAIPGPPVTADFGIVIVDSIPPAGLRSD
jgi:hypothetical protein